MARYASSQEWLEFSVLPTRCWGNRRRKGHGDTGARSIPEPRSTAPPQRRPPAKDCCSTRYCGKLGVDALAIDYSARLDSALTACFEASVAYSVSMSATGSSQPRRDVTPVHPAASRAPRLGSIRIPPTPFDSPSCFCRTTKPAFSPSTPSSREKFCYSANSPPPGQDGGVSTPFRLSTTLVRGNPPASSSSTSCSEVAITALAPCRRRLPQTA